MNIPQHINNENFMYNTMLASALTQLLPAQERKVIRAWIDRLHQVTDDSEREIRNDYMWFLLITLQNKRVVGPFVALPYEGKLQALRDMMAPGAYDDVVKNAVGSPNLQWVDQVLSHQPDLNASNAEDRGSNAPPSKFFSNQPRPKSGIICYMGAFSDQY